MVGGRAGGLGFPPPHPQACLPTPGASSSPSRPCGSRQTKGGPSPVEAGGGRARPCGPAALLTGSRSTAPELCPEACGHSGGQPVVRPAVSARDAACGGGFPLQVAPLQPRPHWHPTAPPRLYRPCASAVTWDPRPGVAGPSSHSQAMTLALQTSLVALLAVVGSRLLTVQEHGFGPGRSPPPPPCRPPGFCSRLPPAPGPRLSFSFSRSSVGVSVTIRSLCPLQPHASWGFRAKRQHRGARRPLADQQGRGRERLAPSPAWVGSASLDHPQPLSQAGGPGGRCGAELGARCVCGWGGAHGRAEVAGGCGGCMAVSGHRLATCWVLAVPQESAG